MILLNAHKIEYSLPGRSLLQEVDLTLSQSEKVGLVGRNGAGKSTLLKILCEKLKPDGGQLTLRNGIRLRYLEQLPELTFDHELSLREIVCLGCPELTEMRQRYNQLCQELEEKPERQSELSDELNRLTDQLTLNDASLFFEPENSDALGFGFRCGFLGMLHMEIIQERLEREYDIDLITTAPTVIYEVVTKQGETLSVDNPSRLPDIGSIEEMREPIVEANILVPQEHIGNVIALCEEKRGVQKNMHFMTTQVQLTYELPMAEVVMDFFDRIKSASRGFASLDYHFTRFQTANLVRLDVLINGERVDALALIVHKEQAHHKGRQLIEKMKELIPRQMFDIAIQAAIGNQVVSRVTVKALRKNVTAKCYGGDVSRKKKLLQKQKEGKKRMKQLGNVEVPQEAFLAVLKVDK